MNIFPFNFRLFLLDLIATMYVQYNCCERKESFYSGNSRTYEQSSCDLMMHYNYDLMNIHYSLFTTL